MAGRNPKEGLGYFPFDVDFFSDLKVRKLIKYQGAKSISVYANVLCIIYKNGYYIKWDSDLPFIISETTGCDEAYISEVMKTLVKINLINKEMFESGIITSKGIQERFKLICEMSRRKINIKKYSLINAEEIPINAEEIPINAEEIPINSVLMQQRKEKERKEKQTLYAGEILIENYDQLISSFMENTEWQKSISESDPRFRDIENIKMRMGEFCVLLKKADQYPIKLHSAKNRFAGWLERNFKKDTNGGQSHILNSEW